MTKHIDNKISRMGAMKSLKVGECVAFPLDALLSVRTTASNINTIRGYKSLTTEVNRGNGVITITRLK